MTSHDPHSLNHHLESVRTGERPFENAFQGVIRMVLEGDIEKVVVNGKTTYDFQIFRTGKKHIIGMYDEINSFVSYVKDAAEGGSSKEMAFVLGGRTGETARPFSWNTSAESTVSFSHVPATENSPSGSRGWSGSATTEKSTSSSPRPTRTP